MDEVDKDGGRTISALEVSTRDNKKDCPVDSITRQHAEEVLASFFVEEDMEDEAGGGGGGPTIRTEDNVDILVSCFQ